LPLETTRVSSLVSNETEAPALPGSVTRWPSMAARAFQPSSLGIQRAALKAAGCNVIRAEKARGVDKRRKSNIDATFASSATAKSSGQPTSHDGAALATPVSIGCLERRRHSHAYTP
jgi:hypothetical protein